MIQVFHHVSTHGIRCPDIDIFGQTGIHGKAACSLFLFLKRNNPNAPRDNNGKLKKETVPLMIPIFLTVKANILTPRMLHIQTKGSPITTKYISRTEKSNLLLIINDYG